MEFPPTCEAPGCGNPAVCIGTDGEGGTELIRMCDECCGHGALGECLCKPIVQGEA